MRNVIFKFQFIVGLLLFACLNVQADDDLITKQITVKLDKAGILPDKIGSTKQYKITNLKIVGEINGTDFRLIREMAGRDADGYTTDGKLAILDLSEAKIVKGGYAYYFHISSCYTSDDVIGYYAFSDCSGLTSVTIPSSVTSIGYCAFSGCSGLTSVTIPSSVTSIDSYAFSGCSGLTSVTIPSSVTSIDSYAFSGCSGLTSVTIPSSVTSIGSSAFKNCSGLTSVTIPSSVTSIDWYTFEGCSGLTSVTIPSSVTSIGLSAFENCSGLTSITIPSSITSIGDYAFRGCSGLTSVYVSWETPLSIAASSFENANTKSCILYVPEGTYDDYWLTDWGVFENIVEYDVTGIDNVTTFGNVKEISRYSVNGQRLDAPTKGLNIVKYSDGSVKKVVVQ